MKRVPFYLSTQLIFFFILSFFFSACYYDNQDELHPDFSTGNCDSTATVSYGNDIIPILNNNCGTSNSCHSSTNTSGIVLNNYSDVRSNAGLMIRAILHDPTLQPLQWMPSGGTTLNSCSRMKIQLWVKQGRLNN